MYIPAHAHAELTNSGFSTLTLGCGSESVCLGLGCSFGQKRSIKTATRIGQVRIQKALDPPR